MLNSNLLNSQITSFDLGTMAFLFVGSALVATFIVLQLGYERSEKILSN